MNVSEAVETRIEVREYADERVDDDARRAILDAGRLASSGKNLQHWHFVLVDDTEGLGELSPTGGWVADADFAVAVLTDPQYDYHDIDAGRAVTHMQLVAWERGVGSCVYTVDRPEAGEFLSVPESHVISLVCGFGYPEQEIRGRKSRKSLSEIAHGGRYGEPLSLD